MTRAFRRGFRGGIDPNGASRFLDDIPEKLIVTRSATRVGAVGSGAWPSGPSRTAVQGRTSRVGNGKAQEAPKVVRRRAGSTCPATPRTAAFKDGDKIRHPKFGDGIVVSTRLSGNDTEVTVAFDKSHGIKRLLLSFAPLEKVE